MVGRLTAYSLLHKGRAWVSSGPVLVEQPTAVLQRPLDLPYPVVSSLVRPSKDSDKTNTNRTDPTGLAQRGASHRKALCVVAARLAERGWLTMARGEPYVICDLAGRPVTPEQARRLIAERFTVPAEVRRRRRSTKQAGKAPHKALKAQIKSQREAGHEATFPTPA